MHYRTGLISRLALLAFLLSGGGLAVFSLAKADVTSAAVDPAKVAGPAEELPALPVVEMPEPEQPEVGLPQERWEKLKTPPRETKGLDLKKLDWSYDCMECHQHLNAKWHYDRPMVEHKNITLDHGNNRFCLNCHHPTNRNAFVDYDGAEIREEDVVLLCAKCHGPTYRDWEAGVHGRRNGHWNEKMGEQTRLRCIQCHDPHSPNFKSMKPLPAPKNRFDDEQSHASDHSSADAAKKSEH